MKIKRIYKFIILTALMIGMSISLILGGQMAAAQMLNDLEIPLMEGLKEDIGERMVFDSPEGRIVMAQASGDINPARAFDYYKVVLFSLSWKIIEENRNGKCEEGAKYCLKARRDQENLSLLIKTDQNSSKVIYSLSPL